MRAVFVVLAYFLISCSPSTKNKVVSGTVSYATEGYIGTSIENYEFTQTNINDSLYKLSYSRKTINPSDTNQRYSHNYVFDLVPGNPHAKQEVTYNNSLSSPLWLLDSRTYHIENHKYTAYKYASNVYADNFCIKADTRIWSPEFGIVIWNLTWELMHASSTNLVKPLLKKDSVIVSILLDSLYHDFDFLRYSGASDKSTIKICSVNTPPVDQPDKIADLRKYIDSTINYPEQAHNACVSGTALVDIKIDTAGNIVDKKIWISEEQFLDYTDIFEDECWRVVESIPGFEPMTFRGKKVPTQYSLPFTFELPDPEMCKEVLVKREENRKKSAGDEVFILTEKMPEFPGGKQALQQYITNELKYPSQARTDRISATVYLSFTIDKDGSMREIKVEEVLASDYQDQFEAEAIRLVKNMPKWNPGKIKEGPVKVRYSLPIRFEL